MDRDGDPFYRSDEFAKDVKKRIFELFDEGNWLDVISLLEKVLPDMLKSNSWLLFDLLSLEYVKILCSINKIEALMFARQCFVPFRKQKTHDRVIEECMILLGYEEPYQRSPLPFVLTMEYKDHIAEKLRKTVEYALESLDPLSSKELFDEEIKEIDARKEILYHASKGQGIEAINLTSQAFPGLLEKNSDLRFELLTLEYLEHVKADRIEEAVDFARKHFEPLLQDESYHSKIEGVMVTLCTVVLPERPYYLTSRYREPIVYKLDKAVRASATMQTAVSPAALVPSLATCATPPFLVA